MDDAVVLLDDAANPIGAAPRHLVHSTSTPLHLAFSCYLIAEDGKVLITRRSLAKVAWPGVWTNACCGHPRPQEAMGDAVRRRVKEELGLDVSPRMVLPDFRYRCADASGIVENEYCPVFVATVSGSEPRPDAGEVMDHTWVPWHDLIETATRAPWALSPWAVLQIRLLSRQTTSFA